MKKGKQNCLSCIVFTSSLTYESGSALVTVATGQLSPAEAERAGLVPTHAYAVLNVVQIKVTELESSPWHELHST